MNDSLFKTNNYGDLVITQLINSTTVHVKFLDTGYETVTQMGHIKRDVVKDKLVPSLYGVGIFGDEVVRVGGKLIKEYMLWSSMLQRCYSTIYQQKRPTYKGCGVSNSFRTYSYFKDWCGKQVGFNQLDDEGKYFALDKDILIKGNKVYSEDTCCFVPQEVNSLLVNRKGGRGNTLIGVSYHKRSKKFVVKLSTGKGVQSNLGSFDTEVEAFKVYKQAKEKHIKEVANKWKGQIDGRVYEALIKYEVEIND